MVVIRLRTIHFRVEIAEKQTAARRCRYNMVVSRSRYQFLTADFTLG
jgi:hypothetical protein